MQRTSTAALACALTALLVAGLVVWRATGGDASAPSPAAADTVAGDHALLPSGRAAPAHAEAGIPPALAASGSYPAGGAVVDREGSPVVGAYVSLDLAGEDRASSTGCATDEAGRFELNLPGEGTLTARAQHPDVGSAVLTLEIGPDTHAAARSLHLVLQPGLAIAGRVQDDTGAAVAGAGILTAVTPVGSQRRSFARASSREDGSFLILGLQQGSARLTCAHDDHVATVVDCQVGDRAVVVTMPRGARIAGVVLDEAGQGVKGASVIVLRPDRSREFAYDSPRIAADGGFTIHGLPREQLEIRPFAVGTLDAAPITIDLREDHDLSGLELRLSRGARITGEVVDTDGQPVAGATVGVELLPDPSVASGGARRSPRRIARFDADGSGNFEVSGLEEARQYALHAQHDGFVPEADAASRQLVRPGQTGVVLVLYRGGSIGGHVFTLEGEPVEGARVTLDGRERTPGRGSTEVETASAADGSYTLRGVARGERKLRCSSREHAEAEPLLVDIGAGEDLTRVDFVLEPLPVGVLAGRVTDQHGAPVAGASLSFRRAVETRDRPRSPGALTNAGGEFRVERVEDLEDLVSFRLEGCMLPDALDSPPRMLPGDFLELQVVRLGVVRGRVVDDAGEPVAGATLTLRRAHDRGMSTGPGAQPGESSIDGTFELLLQSDPMGVSGLFVRAPDRALANEEVSFGFTDPVTDVDLGDISLQRGLVVEGVVHTASGAPAVGALVRLSSAARTQHFSAGTRCQDDGRFRFEGVHAGEYTLRVSCPGHLGRELDIVVSSGNSRTLQIDLESGGSVSGTVTSADGRPVAGARVHASFHSTQTDGDGRYHLGGLAAGTYQVNVKIRTAGEDIHLVEEIDHPGVGDVICDIGGWPSACRVSGRVVGLDAGHDLRSIRDIRLFNVVGGAAIFVEAKLDAELGFTFPPVPPGSYVLDIHLLYTQTLEVPSSPSLEVLVTLTAGRVGGTILRADGVPVHRGTARVRGSRGGDHTVFREMQLDDGGRFLFSNLPAGTYELRVSIDRYGSTHLEGIQLADAQSIENLQIVVMAGGAIVVRILDPGGDLVQTGYLACLDEHGNPPFGPSHLGRTVARRVAPGTWRLEGLSAGRWQVFAGVRPHGTAPSRDVTLGAGETTHLTIQLLADARPLRISITDGGKPAAGAWVSLRDAAGRPFLDVAGHSTGLNLRSNGLFTTGGLPPGTYELEIHLPDREPHRQELTIAPGTGPVERTIPLPQ